MRKHVTLITGAGGHLDQGGGAWIHRRSDHAAFHAPPCGAGFCLAQKQTSEESVEEAR